MTVKISNDVSSERTHQIATKNSCIPLGRNSTTELGKFKFWILGIFFNLNIIVSGELQYVQYLETASHRAK